MVCKILAFILGFTCFIVQIVLLREFISLFMGNELVIAVVLGLWMLLTAFGAWIGKTLAGSQQGSYPIITAILLCGASPLLGIMLTFWLKSELYPPGVMISLTGSILLVLAGLAIFCLVSGMLFTFLASTLAGKEGQKGIANIYAIEALGSLFGGIVFNFILIYILGSIQILMVVLCINFIVAFAYVVLQKKIMQVALGLLSLSVLAIIVFFIDVEETAASMVFPDREIVMSKDTPFGKLVATRLSGQSDIYLNGQVIASSGDIANREEKVHYAMSLHHAPAYVLMLSGGLDGSSAEVVKYRPSVIDYVDQDRWSMKYSDILNISEWPDGINIYNKDPQAFFQKSNEKYDIILFNGAAPNTIGYNRFYTREFFHTIKKHLNTAGIFSTSLPAAGNYMSHEIIMLYSSIFSTLHSEFEFIRIIPGERTYFLASDSPLTGSITESISDRGILTTYVNQYYLDEELLSARAKLIKDQLNTDAAINTSTRPLAAHLSILGWLGLQQIPVLPLILIPVLLMAVIIFRMSKYNIGLFATGFTASSGEFLLLIAFQATYGFIYQIAGLIIMIFMAGLFVGAGFLSRAFVHSKRSFVLIQIILGLSVLLIPVVMHLNIGAGIPGILIGLLTFILAILTGIQFKLATTLKSGLFKEISSSTYGADLAGSAFGIFFIGVFVFPVLGMLNTVLILAGVNVLVSFKIFTSPP